MRESVVRFSDSVIVSVLSSDRLVSSEQFDMCDDVLDKVFKILKPLEIERMVALVRGSVVPTVSGDVISLGSTVSSGYIVIDKEDKKSLEVLAKAVGVKSLKIVTYFDTYKHLIEEPTIVLDEYFDGNVVITCIDENKNILEVESVRPPLVEQAVSSLGEKYNILKVVNAPDGLSSLRWDKIENFSDLPEDQREVLGDTAIALETSGGIEVDLKNKVVSMEQKRSSNSMKGGDKEKSSKEDIVKTKVNTRQKVSKKISDSIFDEEPKWDGSKLAEESKVGQLVSKVKGSLFSKKEEEPEFIKKAKAQSIDGEGTESDKGRRPSRPEKEPKEEAVSRSFEGLSKVFNFIFTILFVVTAGTFILGKVADSRSLSSAKPDVERMQYLTSVNNYLAKTVESNEKGSSYFADTYYSLKSIDSSGIIKTINFVGDKVECVLVSRSQESIDEFQSLLEQNYSIVNVEVVEPSPGDKTGTILTKVTFK